MEEDSHAFSRFEPESVILAVPKKNSYWRKLGGGSLTISIIVHVVLLLLAAVWIIRTIPPPQEKNVDFMPSGGGGGNPASGERTMQKQKAAMMKPNMSRISVTGASSTISLPEMDNASALSSLGALSGGMSGGLGGSGSGGGRGTGQGKGFGGGSGIGVEGGLGTKPIIMFGQELEARRIGVVLDVSGSMTRYLPRVVEELDKVAAGSTVILYRGCALRPDKKGEDERTRPTSGGGKRGEETFEAFWRLSQTNKKYVPDSKTPAPPIPGEAVYRMFSNRMQTFWINSWHSTSAALTAREFRNVDSIYWFADFQDGVDEKEMERLLRNFRRNGQKLYMHASSKGRYTEEVRDKLAVPSGGRMIEVKVLKKK